MAGRRHGGARRSRALVRASWLGAAPPEDLDAGAVRLKRWKVGDAELVAKLVTENLDHLRPWMPWAQRAPTVDEQRAFLEQMRQAWDEHSDFAYGVTLPTGEAIGAVGLHRRRGPGALEIGYWVGVAHCGRGYATAGARALTQAAFDLAGVARVEIRCDEANRASAAVPAKLGYRLVEVVDRRATTPGETGREMVWAVRRQDWPPARRPL